MKSAKLIWSSSACVMEKLIAMHPLRASLIHYIEHAFDDVTLDGGITLYEAAFRADYGSDSRELELAKTAETIDWRRIPTDHLFQRNDAIFFMDSAAKKFYSPAIMRALLVDGRRDGLMLDAFFFDLAGFRSRQENR